MTSSEEGSYPALLTDIYEEFPKASLQMHYCRDTFDICSPRSAIQSKTLPVGFHKKLVSWIICGGLNRALSCKALRFLLKELYQPVSVFLSSPDTGTCSSAFFFALKLPAAPLPVANSYLGLHSPSNPQWTGEESKELESTQRKNHELWARKYKQMQLRYRQIFSHRHIFE